MKFRPTPDEFIKFLKELPEETIRKNNELGHLQAEKSYNDFIVSFQKGLCSICGSPLKTFSEKNPCLHWLLRPKKFKKKHFPILYAEFTYFRVSAYVRWVASTNGIMKNINDLQEEHPGDKLIDFTARHEHITWSFSCNKTDYEGHKSTKFGNSPHYHMQMTLNEKPFISYNDFHIPFHDDDLFDIEILTKYKKCVKYNHGRGAGMQDLMNDDKELDLLIDHTIPTDTPEDATYNLNTMIIAKNGETISGDLVANAIDEAKNSNKTIASVLRKRLKNTNISITTVVSPGDGVPEAQQRKKRKKK